MAFPGTFNVNYYKGDTYEFNVYPKTTSGQPFDMTGYEATTLTISSARGESSIVEKGVIATLSLEESNLQKIVISSGNLEKVRPGMLLVKSSGAGEFGVDSRVISVTEDTIIVSVNHLTAGEIVFDIDERYFSYSDFSEDRSFIKCAIDPAVGDLLDANKTYVYDVEISKTEAPYSKIFTILTGQISITDQVSFAQTVVPEIPVEIPNGPTGLTLTEDPEGTINASWLAPTTGDAPTTYKIYGKAPDASPIPITNYIQFASVNHPITEYSADSVTIAGTSYPLQAGTEYFIKVTASNTAGENTEDFVEDSITLVVPETVPGTVGSLEISARDFGAGTATLSWTAPTTGATVTSYIIAINDNPTEGDGPEDFVPLMTPAAGSATTYDITGLTAFTPYAFTVIAYADAIAGEPAFPVIDGV